MIPQKTAERPPESSIHDDDVAPRAWLEHFAAPRRSGVANWFHSAVRTGCHTPETVAQRVMQDVQSRLKWASDLEQETHLRAVLEALQTDRPGALAYAEVVIVWERLPSDERQRQKQERGRHFQQQYMATQPVTDQQLHCLQTLGHTGETPANRADASTLIDELLSTRQGGRP